MLVVGLTLTEIYYFTAFSVTDDNVRDKVKSVELIQMPDLALVSETIWLRHRSISNVFSVFSEDGALLDYYPSSFIYNVKMNYRKSQVRE